MALTFITGCMQINCGHVGGFLYSGKATFEEKSPGNYITPIEMLNEFTTKGVSCLLSHQKTHTANHTRSPT